MRRLSRSIFVLFVSLALIAPTVNARTLNDDQDPRGGPLPRIVRVIKQIVRTVVKPHDGGGELIPPKP